MSQNTFRLFIALCMILGSMGLPSRASDAEFEPIEISNVSGRDVARLLAVSCPEKTWNVFASWAKRSGFLSRDIADTWSVDTLKNGFKVRGTHLEARASKGQGIEILFNGRKYSGSEPCAVFVEYLKGERHKSVGWAPFVESHALADSLAGDADSNSDAEIMATASSLAGGLVPFSSKLVPAGYGILDISFYLGSSATARPSRKLDFSKLSSSISEPPDVRCSKTLITVTTGVQKIVVRKSPSVSVDLFDRTSDLSNRPDRDSVYWQNSRSFIKQVIQSCTTRLDAEQVAQRADDSLEQTREKVAIIEKNSDASDSPSDSIDSETSGDSAKTRNIH